MSRKWMGEDVPKWGAKEQIVATIWIYLLGCIILRTWKRFQEWMLPVEVEDEDDDSEFWNGGDFYGG